jgi:thymidylate synthase (FAD)
MGEDLTVVNAARVSFNKESYELSQQDKGLMNFLSRHDHWTPFAHPHAIFRVKAPIFVARQLFKHKVGFVENEISRRYVDSDPDFYKPDVWRARAENKKQGSLQESVKYPSYIDTVYEKAINDAMYAYKEMLNKGVAPELARMVLPQSMYTEWYWTASLAGFARAYQLRTHDTAQYESGEIMRLIGGQLEQIYPNAWKVLTE